MRNFTYIDLFSGCGGMSLGLKHAGFKHVFAVERSPMAAETYYRNIIVGENYEKDHWDRHLKLNIREMISAGLYVGGIEDIHSDKLLLEEIRHMNIDVVVGGPPCQGFSMVGKRNPDDIRNTYPYKFYELVEAIQPKAFVMENVIGITLNFKKHSKETPLDTICECFKDYYNIIRVQLNAYHYGVPQRRNRIVVIGIKKEIGNILCFNDQNREYEEKLWISRFSEEFGTLRIPLLAPLPTKKDKAVPLRDALSDICNDGYNSKQPSKYSELMRRGRVGNLANHTLRKHGPLTTSRFTLLHEIRKLTGSVYTANDILGNIEQICLAIESQSKKILLPDGTLILDRESLENAITKMQTKKHSQILMNGKEPSPTVLTIPDDYIHYKYPRVLTVREMARIQSFPDDFVFMGKETTGGEMRKVDVPQYSQVGNAVPPLLAQAIGNRLRELLEIAARKEDTNVDCEDIIQNRGGVYECVHK